MPRTKSAIKRMRKEEKRRLRNKMIKSRMKTFIKRVIEAIERKDPELVRQALVKAISEIDKAASKGVIHKNTASRKKSRLQKKVNAFFASFQTAA